MWVPATAGAGNSGLLFIRQRRSHWRVLYGNYEAPSFHFRRVRVQPWLIIVVSKPAVPSDITVAAGAIQQAESVAMV
jgi:hypothetical protein